MKKYLITAILLFTLITLAACSDNGDTQETSTTQNEYNQMNVFGGEAQAVDAPSEEFKIQIDVATDELLSSFAHLLV